MAQSFSASLSAWVKEVEGSAEAVFKQASQEVLSEAQAQVPVQTGFLRGSLTAGINADPGDITAVRDGNAYSLEIVPAKLGDTVKARWTANYAEHVEYGARGRPARAFMRSAAQRWDQIVKGVEARLGARLGR